MVNIKIKRYGLNETTLLHRPNDIGVNTYRSAYGLQSYIKPTSPYSQLETLH